MTKTRKYYYCYYVILRNYLKIKTSKTKVPGDSPVSTLDSSGNNLNIKTFYNILLGVINGVPVDLLIAHIATV